MNLLHKSESTVTEATYTIQDEVDTFIYKEWRNDSGKVIDAVLRDKDGFDIDDPVILEMIEEYLSSIGE
jgi:uncharacterized protein YycO